MESLEEVKKMLGSADEEERRISVRELASFSPVEIQSLVFGALGDESWRVRKEAVDLVLSFSRDAVLAEELIALLTIHGNAGLRNSVVEVLQSFGEQVIPQLAAYLGHEDSGVRKFIVDIMGAIGSPAVVPLLIPVLLDNDPNVAAAAAESLGLIRDAGALPALLKALEREDLIIRYAILESLVKIGEQVPLEMILPLAAEPLLRKALFECLGVLGGVEAVNLLIDGLKDRARNVREAALSALVAVRGRCFDKESSSLIDPLLKSLTGGEAVEYLMSILESNDRKMKGAALSILGVVGDLRSIKGIIREYADESMQQTSLQALRDLGPAAGPRLLKLFADEEESNRSIIAHISGELGLEECAAVAAAGLSDPAPMVRALSAEALGKSERVEMIPGLVSLLSDQNAEVRRQAVGALIRLAKIARTDVAESASFLAESDNADCRLQAVRLFAALRDAGHLILLSKDENSMVRRESLRALGELQAPESAGRIVMALADEEPEVRLAAANALGLSSGGDGAQSLILAIDDPYPRVRIAALKSLGRRRELSAVERIISLIEDSKGMLLITAIQTLVQICGKSAIPYLLKAEGNADEEVARVAAGLLKEMADGP